MSEQQEHDPSAGTQALLDETTHKTVHSEEKMGFSPAHTLPSLTVRYRIAFTLASAVGGLSSVCIKQVLLPIQVSSIDPITTNTSFALVASVGAFAGLLASPLSGALSDRTTHRSGRRHPWISGGLLVAVCGLLLMARATSILTLLIGEILAQIGVDTVLSCVTAILPDQVPPARRSLLSALNGMAPIVGGVLGLLLVTLFTQPSDTSQGYLLLAGATMVCTIPFLFLIRETPLARENRPPFEWRAFLLGFVAPLRARDFAWTVLSRCLVFLSFTLLGAYLLFSLRARLGFSLAEAKSGVTLFQVLSIGCVLPCSIIGGLLAHKVQCLKPFVLGGAIIMAIGLGLLAVVPSWEAALWAAVVFGCGFGLYVGVGAPVMASVSVR